MSYREDQRKKATAMRESLFRDPGAGLFSKKGRDLFCMMQPSISGLESGMTHLSISEKT